MATVEIQTGIAAPTERCFDLARSIDLHLESQRSTGERAIAGVMSGLIGPGQEVTWEARHLGVKQRFTSRITAFTAPQYFQDTMMRGAFSSFVHDHYFRGSNGNTVMIDRGEVRSPGSFLGALFDHLFMSSYLRRLLRARGE